MLAQVDVLNLQCKLANFDLNMHSLRATIVPDLNRVVMLDDEDSRGNAGGLAADIYSFARGVSRARKAGRVWGVC
jgi:hypothetical protein